ncbi:MAG: sigma-54 dependent transcriptional regulator [Gemmatimonadales bacterium]|jgi:two-component system response regulator HydG|nr:sigma-54 dependent transcriptional regulator [Gemmatimonadales bacterium]
MTSPAKSSVLVVDDNPGMVRLLADRLSDAGFAVELAQGGKEALAAAAARLPDLVITDLRMEEVDGFDVLAGIHALEPTVPVLIMTAYGGIENAIEAMKRGAYHYITKPFRLDEVMLYVERALADRRLRDENRALTKVAVERASFGAMIGRSEPMRALYELIERVAPSQAPVLIRGESGTGKELVARALHFHGPRQKRPFVAVNCTALPEALLESELFGHLKGAFTGATAARRGLLVEASGGTLFLDEIGDMAPGLQAKLLRVLEDGEVRAVGADVARKVDVRIIAASHQPLEERVTEGSFRQDLFYRLNVVAIRLPPLRTRTGDVPLLVDHFLAKARELNPATKVVRLAEEVMSALARSPWPGNVRELENVVTRLVIVAGKETVDLGDLETHAPGVLAEVSPLADAKQQLIPLRQLESEYIAWVMERCGGNKTRAAEILQIDPSTIWRRERAGSG